MKTVNLFLLFMMISIHIFSQGFSNKQGGHCFTMDIPDYMTKTYALNDASSLQYQNTSKEAYVIVIDDDKDHLESLGMKFINSKDFLENFVNDYKKDSKKRKLTTITEFDFNGNSHAQVELTWKEDDTDFYMLITVVETKTHFYKILCWTVNDNLDKLKDDYLNISKSVKD